MTQVFLNEAEKHYNRYLDNNSAAERGATLWNLRLAQHVAPNNQAVVRLLDKLEAEEGAARPHLESESVLWKRLQQGGLLDEMPEAPSSPGPQP
jgi:hypothetical protein